MDAESSESDADEDESKFCCEFRDGDCDADCGEVMIECVIGEQCNGWVHVRCEGLSVEEETRVCAADAGDYECSLCSPLQRDRDDQVDEEGDAGESDMEDTDEDSADGES